MLATSVISPGPQSIRTPGMAEAAKESIERAVAVGAAMFQDDPARVLTALPGSGAYDAEGLRELLEVRIQSMIDWCRQGAWPYDFNRHMILLQIRVAAHRPGFDARWAAVRGSDARGSDARGSVR